MQTYRINDRKKRYFSPVGLGQTGREKRKISPIIGQPFAEKFRHSPYIYRAGTSSVNSSSKGKYTSNYPECYTYERDVPVILRAIDESKMSAIARVALRRNNFRIQGWRTCKLEGGNGNPVNLGLYRFEGIGVDRNEWLDWSIILKVIQSPANLGYENMGEADDQTHWNYWKRELLLYQSGWLDTLPEGISSPRCFDTLELPGNIAGLWLEDITDSYSSNWPLYRYALTARHLGRLNGVYISRRKLPDFSWFSLERTKQWLNMIPWKDFPWDDSETSQYFSKNGSNHFRHFLEEHGKYLTRLEQIPHTVSHGDTFPTNFRSRRVYRGQEQTIAIDWAQAGIAPLGDDLGQLVYGTCMNLKAYKMQDISQTLFTSYINGLQDSGCRVEPELVRFGYVASAAFRVGLFKLSMLQEEFEKNGKRFHPNLISPAAVDSFESVMAEEAHQLLDHI